MDNADKTIDAEIARTLRAYVHRTPAATLRAYCRTAEDWRNGSGSMMTKLSRAYGQLDSELDYQKLADEADRALKECVLSDERGPLVALANWAREVTAVATTLRRLSVEAYELVARYGLYDAEALAVVQHAVRIARESSADAGAKR